LDVGKSPRVLEQVLQNAKHFAFFSAEVVQKLRFLNNSIYKNFSCNSGAFPALRAGNRALRGSARQAPWVATPIPCAFRTRLLFANDGPVNVKSQALH
jgi:hypothetical protein